MTKNKPSLEIVPRNRIEESQRLKDALTQLIDERVSEAISGPTSVIEPFFHSKRLLTEIRRVQSVPERNKFTYYFERWGCMICGTHEGGHGAVGMCYPCYRRTSERLKSLVRQHSQHEETYHDAADLAVASLDPSINAINVTPNHKGRERYYTQVEACAKADIDPKTLYVWLRDGVVQPSIQISPKRWMWTDADVEELKAIKARNASLHNSKAARGRWAKKKALPAGESSQ